MVTWYFCLAHGHATSQEQSLFSGLTPNAANTITILWQGTCLVSCPGRQPETRDQGPEDVGWAEPTVLGEAGWPGLQGVIGRTAQQLFSCKARKVGAKWHARSSFWRLQGQHNLALFLFATGT